MDLRLTLFTNDPIFSETSYIFYSKEALKFWLSTLQNKLKLKPNLEHHNIEMEIAHIHLKRYSVINLNELT